MKKGDNAQNEELVIVDGIRELNCSDLRKLLKKIWGTTWKGELKRRDMMILGLIFIVRNQTVY